MVSHQLAGRRDHARALRPRAGVAAGGIFQQALAVAIHGQHLGGPDLQSGIVLLQPRLVLAAAHVVPGSEHERWVGIHEVVGQGRLSGVRHAIRRHAAQIAVERLPDEVERGHARRERRCPLRHRGIFIQREGTNVAGRIVGQRAVPGTQLENVQPVAPKAVEAGIVRQFRRPGINGRHVQSVVDAGHDRRGRGKGYLHEIVRLLRSLKTPGVVAKRQRHPLRRGGSDSQRPFVGQVQYRREAYASILIDEAQKGGMSHVGVEVQHHWGRWAGLGISRV